MRDPASAVIRPLPRPDAERRLVCLSFCGGGTAPFRPWAKVLPPEVELALICYPGREVRFDAPFAPDWRVLRDDTLAAVSTLMDRPCVLFGHSMGARMAFEVTAYLEQTLRRVPQALVVSASDAPTNWERQRLTRPAAHDPDETLLDWLREVGQLSEVVFAEPELRRIALDLLRADLRVIDSYRCRPGVTVRAPVQVLYGAEDADVGADGAAAWRPLAGGPFRVDELPGGHFYTEEIWPVLPTYLAALADRPTTLARS